MSRLIYASKNNRVLAEMMQQFAILPSVGITWMSSEFRFVVSFIWLNIAACCAFGRRKNDDQ